jgi:hypothetical protein
MRRSFLVAVTKWFIRARGMPSWGLHCRPTASLLSSKPLTNKPDEQTARTMQAKLRPNMAD